MNSRSCEDFVEEKPRDSKSITTEAKIFNTNTNDTSPIRLKMFQANCEKHPVAEAVVVDNHYKCCQYQWVLKMVSVTFYLLRMFVKQDKTTKIEWNTLLIIKAIITYPFICASEIRSFVIHELTSVAVSCCSNNPTVIEFTLMFVTAKYITRTSLHN
uniref:Uncharacterized protein n=1 Tax=Glossina palpalis gambiensis TaxID=67801 RepID=A0A1B0ANS2_9MUSC